jgi:hypothetical protein
VDQNQLKMDHPQMQAAAAEMRTRVANMVSQAFASAPSAASAAAGANMNYAFSLATVAHFAQVAMAVKKLVDAATEHANLIDTTSRQAQEQDALRAAREFNVATTFPTQRGTGSTNA